MFIVLGFLLACVGLLGVGVTVVAKVAVGSALTIVGSLVALAGLTFRVRVVEVAGERVAERGFAIMVWPFEDA